MGPRPELLSSLLPFASTRESLGQHRTCDRDRSRTRARAAASALLSLVHGNNVDSTGLVIGIA
eukprot:2291948-Rhodomonas_salina.1